MTDVTKDWLERKCWRGHTTYVGQRCKECGVIANKKYQEKYPERRKESQRKSSIRTRMSAQEKLDNPIVRRPRDWRSNYRHGLKGLPIYYIHCAMLQRCENPNDKGYKNYGGRGIKVCDRWHDVKNFFEDMGHPPKGLTLERIDVNGDYEPSNCRWATWKEQANNKRKSAAKELV